MRSRSFVSSRRFGPLTRAAWRGGFFALLSPTAHAAEPTVPAREKVHIVYRAPPECPDEQAFLAGVRARIGTEWEASPQEMAREIDATVNVTPAGSAARIDFTDTRGRHMSRTISSDTCTEVVAALALITALAIESGVTETGEPENGEAPTDARTTEPGGSSKAAPAVVAAPPPAAPAEREPAQRSSSAPAAWHWDVGALGAVSSGVGPVVAWGGRFVTGIGWPRGPDFRLGVDYLTTAAATVPVNGGTTLQSYQLDGRFSGCPFVIGLGGGFRTLPCAGIYAGIIHAETRASAGVLAPGAANPAIIAPFAELRVDLKAGNLFVEGSAEVRFAVSPPAFALDPPYDTQHLYDVPVVAVGGSLGVGLRL